MIVNDVIFRDFYHALIGGGATLIHRSSSLMERANRLCQQTVGALAAGGQTLAVIRMRGSCPPAQASAQRVNERAQLLDQMLVRKVILN